MKISVIGAGSWGTAIASLLGEKHPEVSLWARHAELAAKLNEIRENPEYLSGIFLPPTVTATNDLAKAVDGASIVVLVTPSHAVRETAQKLRGFLNPDVICVTAAKGLEVSSLKCMSEVIADELPECRNRIAVLSGPNHAEEVGVRQPTATVAAADSREVAEMVQDAFICPFFRVYTNPDVRGVELGGALKNIIALGAGIVEGLGFGDNTKAALMTRGVVEISRLGVALGANPSTFNGLAGIGDLIVTCTSRHSRNHRAGILLGQGKTIDEIQAQTNMVVEGIRSTRAAYQLAAIHKVDMPITTEIFHVLYEGKSPRQAALDLMTRARTHELEEVAAEESISWKIP